MRLLKCAIGLLASALAVLAQTDRGTITGTISDPAGAVVANAAVEAKNADTAATYQVGSSATGNYTLAQMPAGTYEISVAVPGFKKVIRPGIIVNVASTVRVDFALEVGAATESVTVQADAPLLKTESGELSHTVDFSRMDNLPMLTLGAAGTLGNIRNPLASIVLMPGSAFQSDNTLRINGMPSSTAAIRIEGQDATNGMWKQLTQATQSGVDAIQELAVQTSNFAAEYGQVGGGYFNYTMRSGSNQFHGSAYDYINNEALNASVPFTNIRNGVRRHDYGFTLGGPVRLPHYDGRDKTFFFFNFEQFRETQMIRNGLATVPTDAYRAGDFSKATFVVPTPPDPLGRSFPSFTVMDPNSTFTGPGGSLLRNPYSSNQVPSTQFDTIAVKLQALIPRANVPGASINNYAIPAYSNFRHTTIPSIKIDQAISSTMKVSGYMSVTRTESPSANGFAAATLSTIPTDDTTYTTRINFDDTLRPTLLLHAGIGLMYFTHPQFTTNFDQSQYWPANAQFAANNYAPSIGAAYNFFTGGVSMGSGLFGGTGPGAPGFANVLLKDIKPTANLSLTWVRGNHTYKAGGELIIEGFPQQSAARANGGFNFSNLETSNPWENGNVSAPFQTGFPYASFLLGKATSMTYSALTDSRLGNHTIGLFLQDTWKVTRKFTLEYGIRYDYVTLLKEQYGRMQSASFSTPNPVVGNRLGSVIYEGTCGCSFNNNYPWALGPRLGGAYQINQKTVLRVGGGLAYGTSPNNAFLSYSVPDFYTLNAPGYALAATQLSAGNPYAPGNPFGNPVTVYPNFTPQFPSRTASGLIPVQSPFISIDRNAGRPARILQWSIGLQREVARNLVVEATYVGNRGVWWTAPVLDIPNYNALTPTGLLADRSYGATRGIDISQAADRALLTTPISSPLVVARYPGLANPNNVYPGFPGNQPLNQALRPQPQWNGVPPFLGPPLGDTWYDSLQIKATKRYSHGLDVQGAFTWQKELTNGANSDTSYFTPGTLLINDVYNRPSLKQISSLSRPVVLVVSFSYTTPKIKGDTTGSKVLSVLARDWVIGSVLRYQSGQVIATPPSSNNLLTQLARGLANNPALFGGGNTFENRNPGVSLLNVDPNCHCFNPQTTLPLNTAAWTDAAPGQFGTAAAYYNDYRWQRQPAESLSLGRAFRMFKERASLNVRVEFQNVFNRVFLTQPSIGGFGVTNTNTAPGYTNGVLTAGYGYINTTNPALPGFAPQPRSGQIVARFTF